MDNRKWLARAGALLVLLGFVLPSMTVSCAGLSGYGKTFTMAEFASGNNQPVLYLVPLGVLAAVILSFIPITSSSQRQLFFWGQVTGVASGLLSVIIVTFSIYNQIQSSAYGMLDISPQIGLFVLGLGYILMIVGLFLQFPAVQQSEEVPVIRPVSIAYSPPPDYSSPQPSPPQLEERRPLALVPYAQLSLVKGNAPMRVVTIDCDNFSIGRSPENNLQLSDPEVSRTHVKLRFAKGAWYLQDQGSTAGTFVNGQAIKATRLNTGDRITIAENTFVFQIE